MEKKKLFALTAVGLAAAIAIPTIAFGNARTNTTDQTPQTPFVANLLGANEVPAADPDGFGSAAVTFDLDALPPNVCWDLSYGNLNGVPVMAHIHGPAAAGANANVVIAFTPFTTLTATGASACRDLTPTEATVAADIVVHPENYYVNVHTGDYPNGAIRGQLAKGAAPSGEAHLLTEPLRAYDSRTADGPLVINGTRTVNLGSGLDGAGTAHVAVPAGATGAIVTLTVTNTGTGVGGPGGFLKIYNADLGTPPSISNINWFGANQNLAVTTQVAVNANGQVKVTDGANATDFIVDVIGFVF